MKRKGYNITKIEAPLVVGGRVVEGAYSVARSSDDTPLGVVATADEVDLLISNDKESLPE